MHDVILRKYQISVEEIYHEGGPAPAKPRRSAASGPASHLYGTSPIPLASILHEDRSQEALMKPARAIAASGSAIALAVGLAA